MQTQRRKRSANRASLTILQRSAIIGPAAASDFFCKACRNNEPVRASHQRFDDYALAIIDNNFAFDTDISSDMASESFYSGADLGVLTAATDSDGVHVTDRRLYFLDVYLVARIARP